MIADEFMAMFPNVTIEWDRTKGDDWPYWMTTQLAAGTAPDICFLQGSQFADRGWFIPLNDYLLEKNVFVEDNAVWKEMVPRLRLGKLPVHRRGGQHRCRAADPLSRHGHRLLLQQVDL